MRDNRNNRHIFTPSRHKHHNQTQARAGFRTPARPLARHRSGLLLDSQDICGHRPAPRRAARATFIDELRDAIEASDLVPYVPGKAVGVDSGILSRPLAGHRGMTTDAVDWVAAALVVARYEGCG